MNTRLNQRINKVEHWTSEIDEKLTDLNNEIDALLDYKVFYIFLLKICTFASLEQSITTELRQELRMQSQQQSNQ